VVVELRLLDRPVDEGGVEAAGADVGEQLAVPVRLDDVDDDVRRVRAQPSEPEREQASVGERRRADPEHALARSRERLDLGAGARDLARDLLSVFQHDLSDRGRDHRLRPARPFQHAMPDDPLERCHLLADRRLAVAQPACGTAERPFRDDRREGLEVAQFDTAPVRRMSNRCQFVLRQTLSR
jgi:hypothetical protein